MVTNAYLYNGYTVTKNFVKNINVCRNCGYRLYAKDDQQVRTGNGNINGNAVIVVRNARDAIILSELYKELVKDESSIYDNFYITYSIRCDTNSQIGFDSNCIRFCAHILHDELCMITNITDIVFVGPRLLELYTQAEVRIPNTLLGKRNFDCISSITLYKHKSHVGYNRYTAYTHFVNEFKNLLTKYNIPIREFVNNQIKDD